MKKILLMAAVALMATSASAQLQQTRLTTKPIQNRVNYVQKPEYQMQEMKAANSNPSFAMGKAPKKASFMDAYYIRPAGLFPGSIVMEDGAYSGGYYMPLYFAKPYVDYAFTGVIEGGSDELAFEWQYQKWNYIDAETGWSHDEMSFEGNPLVVNYVNGEENEVPKMTAYDDGIGNMYTYQPGGYEMSGTSDKPVVGAFHVSYIETTPSNYDFYEVEGTDLLVSSKTFCSGGRHADQRYQMTYYSGCDPYGDNEEGWWFGKNGGRANGMPIDGIGQAFEKPTSPYLLKQVVLDCAVLEVVEPVEMTCRVYKLADGIPAYDDERPVALPEEPGELIAMGRATLTPETNEATGGLIVFTLYGEEDGLEYEITPTIDDAIFICVDGYNDPGMEGLKDFSALVCSDGLSNEGYGELAYIKYGQADEDGNFSGDYVWAGLNNFFSSGQMMTGLTIFITVDNPFLIFNYNDLENAEYTFPAEGGLMEKVLYEEAGQQLVTRSIEFYSYMPSVDDGWTMTCNGDDVPEWLNIELTDDEDEDGFTGLVTAEVVADPLPEGVAYREAVVRFEFPGTYIDYKFMQGTKPDVLVGDVNQDGEVNIADVNALIDMILSANTDKVGDVNEDGEVNIADVNELINIILAN